MVEAQYRLLKEGLGVRHLRLVIGNSMGGMHAWLWGAKYPDYMDALVPMASQPSEMASRNWMLRRLLIDTVRSDPDYNGRQLHRRSRARCAWPTCSSPSPPTAARWPSRSWRRRGAGADKLVDDRLAAPFNADANDFIYQWESSRDYNASPGLERIQAALLAINSADDERNPPETGIMERELKRVKNGRLLSDPGQRGHARPRHHRHGQVLEARKLQDVPADGAQAGDVAEPKAVLGVMQEHATGVRDLPWSNARCPTTNAPFAT